MKFFILKRLSATEITKELVDVYGHSIPSYLGLTKSWCIDRKKYEDKEKALILFHFIKCSK